MVGGFSWGRLINLSKNHSWKGKFNERDVFLVIFQHGCSQYFLSLSQPWLEHLLITDAGKGVGGGSQGGQEGVGEGEGGGKRGQGAW